MKKARKKAFTLVEILAVISIIAILAGMTVGVSSLVMRKSADTKTRAAMKNVEIALERFREANGYYPPSRGGTISIFRFVKAPDTTTPEGLREDALSKLFDEKFRSANTCPITISGTQYLYIVDAYGNPLVYRCPGYFNKGKYDLGSTGKDEKLGDGAGKKLVIDSSTGGFTNSGTVASDFTDHFGLGDDLTNFTRQ
ncbi:MAG: prepilin-type N-terminal cleavage/methylation domain-containing protein [Lentisphaeria bacterium]|nr:prepilin-type N-terminal cleavage/methylation domain-containing protein [Lentisphaeria bacterium]